MQIVNTVIVHVSLAVLLVQDFWEELLTRIIRSFYIDIKLCVFEENQWKEAFTVICDLCS